MDLKQEPKSKAYREECWLTEEHSDLLQEYQGLLPEVKAVSFDVFDTTLQRVVYPKEVFALVEVEAVTRFGHRLRNFADKRIRAEVDARKRKKKESGHCEIGLEAIYEELLRGNSDWAPWMSELLEIEFAQELRCNRAHPLGWRLWQLAQSSDCQICFISDMYLGEERIKSLLLANGYRDAMVICSSDYGCNKSNGKLYHLAAKQLGFNPGEILHLGDNALSDQKRAQQSGFKNLPFPPPSSPPKQAKHFSNVTEQKNTAAVISGIIRQEITTPMAAEGSGAAQPGKHGMGRKIGYSVLGPMTYGLCHWLADRIAEDKRDLVLFLGRDGYLPHKILSSWQSRYDCLPKTRLEYFPSSRRATAVACAADGVSPLVRDTLGHHRRSVPLRDYFERIGLDPGNHLDAIKAAGFHSPEEVVHRSTGRPRMEHLIELLESQLKEVGKTEKQALLEALKKKGFGPAKRPAIFDLGWRGTQHACLQSIIGDSPELYGYYLSISDTFAASGTTTGYLVNDGKPSRLRGLFESATPVVELFYSSPEPSLLHYSLTQNRITPNYDRENPNRDATQELQEGALDFIDTLTDFYQGPHARICKNTATKAFAQIAVAPSKEEHEFFQFLVFSDALGCEKGQTLTATHPPSLQSYLFDYPIFFEAYSETYWRADFIRNMSLPAKLWIWPRSPSFRRIWRMMRRWEYRFGERS